jgi:ankyrin repeat protein
LVTRFFANYNSEDKLSAAIRKSVDAAVELDDHDDRKTEYTRLLWAGVAYHLTPLQIFGYLNPGQLQEWGFRSTGDYEVSNYLLSAASLLGKPELLKTAKHGELSISNELFGFPLVCAARMGHRDVVSGLLERIQNSKFSEGRLDVRDALAAAAERGDKELVDLLFDSKMFNPKNVGPLELVILAAARGGHESLIDYFIQNCPDPAISECFVNSSLGMGNLTLVYRIFTEATTHGRVEIVRRCLANGVVFFQDDKGAIDLGIGTALEKAAHFGYPDIVRLIVNCIGEKVQYRKEIMLRAISKAARRGHKDVIRVLVDSGISLSQGEIYGWHPLEAASGTGQAHIVKYLLGPTINIRGCEKFDQVAQRAMRYAAGKGYESVIRELIKAGVPVNDSTTPPERRSAMLTAMVAGRKNVVQLLRENGAKDIDPSTTRFAGDFESGKFPVAEIVANEDADRNGSQAYPGRSWNGF